MIALADKARANMYRQLAMLERSGLPIVQGLAQMAGHGGPNQVLNPVVAALEDGQEIGEAFAGAPGFSRLEARVIAAGSQAGMLPACYNQLAELFEDRAKVKFQLVSALAYPTCLLHAAAILPNLAVLVQQDGGLGPFLVASLGPLFTLYFVLTACFVGYRVALATTPELVGWFVLSIPMLGGVVRRRALVVSLKALEILYRNGISILDATEAAAEVCPNRWLAATFQRIREHLGDGADVGEAFAREGAELPRIVVEMTATGAATGRLDELLAKTGEQLDQEATQMRGALLVAAGVGVFLLVAAVVAYQVISFYTGFLYGDRLKGF